VSRIDSDHKLECTSSDSRSSYCPLFWMSAMKMCML